MPKISVLTPLYNAEPDQLKEMIESALAAQPIQYYTIITFDREYTAIDSETDSGENF